MTKRGRPRKHGVSLAVGKHGVSLAVGKREYRHRYRRTTMLRLEGQYLRLHDRVREMWQLEREHWEAKIAQLEEDLAMLQAELHRRVLLERQQEPLASDPSLEYTSETDGYRQHQRP